MFSSLPGAMNLSHVNPSCYTVRQWASAFSSVSAFPLRKRIAAWADLTAVDAEYVLGPLGEGPGAVPDTKPLSDFQHVDCQTYIEQVYALALSHSRQEFDETLRHIRYKESIIDFRWRNHYTVTDWLPANAWCIRDVTDEVGSGFTRPMTKTISHAKFFADHGLPQYHDLPDIEQTTEYVPRTQVKDVMGRLKTGDLVIFVVSTPGIISGHVGMIRCQGTTVSVQHASQTAKKVIISPLEHYVDNMPARFVGCKFARPIGE